MHAHPLPAGVALALVLGLAGCATSDIATRIQEKSGAYATLTHAQKRKIDRGIIAVGFTPDMVYMAMGPPSHIEPLPASEGTGERWVYNNFYPQFDARHLPYAGLNSDTNYLPGKSGSNPVATVAVNRSRSSMYNSTTVQGGSMEPADLPSFTILVWFKEGQVSRIAARPT